MIDVLMQYSKQICRNQLQKRQAKLVIKISPIQQEFSNSQKQMDQKIILLRHAQSGHNKFKKQVRKNHKDKRVKETQEYREMRFSKILQDNGLTQQGINQCKLLKTKFDWNQIGLVIASPSRRCLQTAHYLFQGIKNVSIKIEPLLFSRITNAWSLGSPKQQLQEEFPEFNLEKLDETDGPWYAQILTPQMHKYFTGQIQALQVLEAGNLQSYRDFQTRSLKIRQLIDNCLKSMATNKKLLIISHSKVLKLLTAVKFRQDGKALSKIQFQNAIPYQMTRNQLFSHSLPHPKM